MNKYVLALCYFLFSLFLSHAQERVCVDSSHYDPSGICFTLYDPVCGCEGSTPSNSCFAFYEGLSCWSQNCDIADRGCEVAIDYHIMDGQVFLKDLSPTADGDSVVSWRWEYNYEEMGENAAETVMDIPAGAQQFLISLNIYTAQGCTAYCTFKVSQSMNSAANESPAGMRFFPNPASGTLWLENPQGYRRLVVFSLDGQRLLNISLDGSGRQTVDVDALGLGLYLLRLEGHPAGRAPVSAKLAIQP